jgi:hypothetical protein
LIGDIKALVDFAVGAASGCIGLHFKVEIFNPVVDVFGASPRDDDGCS